MSVDETTEHAARRSGECAELLSFMHEQERICRRLLDLSAGERIAMAEGRVDDLEISTREKSSLIEQMDSLERKRREVARRLAMERGLAADTPLIGLAARMGPEDAEDLLQVRGRVVDTVGKLSEANEGNLALMKQSLELVRNSIRQLKRATGPGEVYTSSGQSHDMGQGNAMVDCHV